MARLPEFQLRMPRAELEMSASDRQVDMVREGFDCMVRAGALQDSTLVARSLPAALLRNVASPAYLQRYGCPHGPGDLPHHRLIQFAPAFNGPVDGFEYLSGEHYVTVPMTSGIVVNSSHMLLEACLAGFGMMQAPLLSMQPHLQGGRLIEILPNHRAAPMPVAILYPHRRHLARRVAVFIDWLADVLRTLEA